MAETTETLPLETAGELAAMAPGSSDEGQVVPPVVEPEPAGTQKVYVWLTWLLLGSVTVRVADSAWDVLIEVAQWNVRS